jgi:hypothetical protein
MPHRGAAHRRLTATLTTAQCCTSHKCFACVATNPDPLPRTPKLHASPFVPTNPAKSHFIDYKNCNCTSNASTSLLAASPTWELRVYHAAHEQKSHCHQISATPAKPGRSLPAASLLPLLGSTSYALPSNHTPCLAPVATDPATPHFTHYSLRNLHLLWLLTPCSKPSCHS